MNTTRILSHPGTYALACTILLANSLVAASIGAGQANIDGAVTVTYTTVDFFDTAGVTPNIYDMGTGTGSFMGLTTPGTIQNLTDGPVTGNISVIQFATFTAAAGLINFDITHIDPGTGTLADCSDDTVGSVCTPSGSPFTLSQVSADTVGFTFSMEGFAYTGPSGTGESAAQALFTGQQVPGTITEVLAQLAGSVNLNTGLFTPGSFSNTYSATFSTLPAVPEPGTFAMFLIGAGLLGMGAFRGRRPPF